MAQRRFLLPGYKSAGKGCETVFRSELREAVRRFRETMDEPF